MDYEKTLGGVLDTTNMRVFNTYVELLGEKIGGIKSIGQSLKANQFLDQSLIGDFEHLKSKEIVERLNGIRNKFDSSDGVHEIATLGNGELYAKFPTNRTNIFSYKIKVPYNKSFRQYRFLYEYDTANNAPIFLRDIDIDYYDSVSGKKNSNPTYKYQVSSNEHYIFNRGASDSSGTNIKYIKNIKCNGNGKKEVQINFSDEEENFSCEHRVKKRNGGSIIFDAVFGVGKNGRRIPVISGNNIPIGLLNEIINLGWKDLFIKLDMRTREDFIEDTLRAREASGIAFLNIGQNVMQRDTIGRSI